MSTKKSTKKSTKTDAPALAVKFVETIPPRKNASTRYDAITKQLLGAPGKKAEIGTFESARKAAYIAAALRRRKELTVEQRGATVYAYAAKPVSK